MGIASTHVNSTVPMASSTVFTSRSPMMTSVMRCWYMNEIPQSKRSIRHAHFAYWTTRGWSRP